MELGASGSWALASDPVSRTAPNRVRAITNFGERPVMLQGRVNEVSVKVSKSFLQ
jgi:hypothetical protein